MFHGHIWPSGRSLPTAAANTCLGFFYRLTDSRPTASWRRGATASLPPRKVSVAAEPSPSLRSRCLLVVADSLVALITSPPAGGVLSLPPTKPAVTWTLQLRLVIGTHTHTHTRRDAVTQHEGFQVEMSSVLRKFQRK